MFSNSNKNKIILPQKCISIKYTTKLKQLCAMFNNCLRQILWLSIITIASFITSIFSKLKFLNYYNSCQLQYKIYNSCKDRSSAGPSANITAGTTVPATDGTNSSTLQQVGCCNFAIASARGSHSFVCSQNLDWTAVNRDCNTS